MASPREILRQIRSYFRDPDTKHPHDPQPIFDADDYGIDRQTILDEIAAGKRDKYGTVQFYDATHYQNVVRITVPVGRDPTLVSVENNEFLTGHVTLIGPDGQTYDMTLSLSSGQDFNAKDFDARLKNQMAKRRKGKEDTSSYVNDAIREIDWYLHSFVKKADFYGHA